MEKYLDLIYAKIINYGPKVIGAILMLVIGFWLISKAKNALTKYMSKSDISPSLQPFLRSLLGATLKVLLVISVLSLVGIPTTSFVAVMGAAGLAVGMALSGTLQNFASGVMILTLKPFKVGDFIEAAGQVGVVNEIQIFSTIIKTGDNKVIIIPNNKLSNDTVVNYSIEEKRRVDMTFGIGYGDNADKAKTLLQSLIAADDRVLKDPEPFIAVTSLGASSVDITIRMWVNASDYWPVYHQMNETVYNEFDKAGLNIPYPQMDIHVHKN